MLSNSALDDPIYYILTTSEKTKHAQHPYPNDLVRIPAGTYSFFSVDTLIDVGEAGQLEIDRDEFNALFDAGELLHKGSLSDTDVAALKQKLVSCARVSRRFKQLITNS